VLAKLRWRYAHASTAYKSKFIDQIVGLFGLHRKSAIRALRRAPPPLSAPALLGRPVEYRPAQLLSILKPIWLACQQPCGKRLVAALPDWLPFCKDDYHRLGVDTRQQLLSASAATPWDVTRPDFLELDTVALCGGSLAGDFSWMLDSVDSLTQWVEARAVWNKGWYNILEQLRDIETRLPFVLLGIDHDNGGELLNWRVLRYCQERRMPVQISRSRPYHRDDNAHIEKRTGRTFGNGLGMAASTIRTLCSCSTPLPRAHGGNYSTTFVPC